MDELSRFLADMRFLTSLKIEGCSNLGSLTLLSSSLSILWISDLYCLSKMGKRTILVSFPPAARRMDMLNDLLPSSALISLHCALTNETVQIINAERLQHVKPVLLAVRWMVLNGHNGWIMGISIDLMSGELSKSLILYADKVDMLDVKGEFSTVITRVLLTLVQGLETKLMI
ncbi:hypothetical protein C5167_035971 [Papaver somniferum]|nr:hypothetical protein C5167_035971 [Papaver somniferum]